LISQNEYDKVKRKLMKEYHIISSIMNWQRLYIIV
jgi:hypothetical protein